MLRGELYSFGDVVRGVFSLGVSIWRGVLLSRGVVVRGVFSLGVSVWRGVLLSRGVVVRGVFSLGVSVWRGVLLSRGVIVLGVFISPFVRGSEGRTVLGSEAGVTVDLMSRFGRPIASIPSLETNDRGFFTASPLPYNSPKFLPPLGVLLAVTPLPPPLGP